MFYCDACRTAKNLPGIIEISYGRCEICGQTAPCYDTPSKDIP